MFLDSTELLPQSLLVGGSFDGQSFGEERFGTGGELSRATCRQAPCLSLKAWNLRCSLARRVGYADPKGEKDAKYALNLRCVTLPVVKTGNVSTLVLIIKCIHRCSFRTYMPLPMIWLTSKKEKRKYNHQCQECLGRNGQRQEVA